MPIFSARAKCVLTALYDVVMLKSNVIWPESRRFKSHTEWEPLGFFSEGLCNATSFDLKLGFFSSSAINVLCDGFAYFLYNGGRMRLIINDILSGEDKEAILRGESDDTLTAFDLDNLERLKETLSERSLHFFECLAWLIRNNRVDIKVITPKFGCGISHFKCGLFSDGVNKVAFDGSCNFSRTALIENCESITAFCDWDGGKDIYKINDIEEDFALTFDGRDETVDYVSPEAIRTKLTNQFLPKDLDTLLTDEQRVIEIHSQVVASQTIRGYLQRAKDKVTSAIERVKRQQIEPESVEPSMPRFPYASGPREYQKEAFEQWKKSQKGLFAMATGTGKTLTALNCLLEIYKRKGYYKAIILVPTITLVDQWYEECENFHYSHIYKVCSKNKEWRNEIESLLLKEDFNPLGKPLSYIIISTYASFARDSVFPILNSFPKKFTLLIADEAHNMGSGRILDKLNGIKYLRRIGLSATPHRQFDDLGNSRLNEFFGVEDDYTFEFSMREAIDKGFLCRYYYYPHIVYLDDEEMAEYLRISVVLAKYFNFEDCTFSKTDDVLMALLLKRKRIIHKARAKECVFRNILQQRYMQRGNLKYTLVYVPEGNKPDDTVDVYDTEDNMDYDDCSDHLIDRYTQIVSEVSPQTTVRKFTADSTDRNQLLADFASGAVEVLTSMKCLDEGVDVPRSEMAIFCASTGNPRQFIQRRGRILRKHKDKPFAVIHDLVVVPIVSSVCESFNMEKNLLANELIRVRDFASLSENADAAYRELDEVTSYYNLNIL